MGMKLLFVSIAFPPKGDPESLQVLKYYKGLLKKSLDITVVTSKNPTLFMEPDDNLSKFYSGFNQLLEIPIKESKWSNFINRKLKGGEVLSFPDSKASFFSDSKKIAEQIKSQPEIVYSRSYPLSSSILAFHLAETFDVPWVMHLSDPWSFKKRNDSQLSEAERWNLDWERKCIERADVVTFTSEKTVSLYKSKYPEFTDKFRMFPNVYELDTIDPTKSPNLENKRITITYTGGLTRERNPEVFLECFKELSEEIPGLSEKLQVNLIGPKDRYVKAMIKNFGLTFVHDISPISYEESKERQKKSDLLLLVDAPNNDPSKTVFFPSKILDYVTTFRPILAMSPKSSTTTDVIKKYGFGEAFCHSQKNEIKTFIKNSLDNGFLSQYRYETLPLDFDASYNVIRLVDLFKELTDK